MKTKRIGFFSRIYLAITDFRIYPFTQKESIWTALGYFVKFTLLASLIIAFGVVWIIYDNSVIVVEEFDKAVPNFQISNGILIADSTSSGELLENLYYFLDSEKTYTEKDELINKSKIDYDYYLLFFQDETALITKLDEEYVKVFGLQHNMLENANKAELVEQWKSSNESYLTRLMIVLLITLCLFIVYTVAKLWNLILNMVSAFLINFIFAVKLKFSGYLKLVIYATTLSSLLEVISILLIHKIPELAEIITSIISFVYLYYGIRTIKIDELIVAGIGNTPEERVKDALLKAQKEIQEQLDEMEKQDKEKASKENEESISDLDANDSDNIENKDDMNSDNNDEPKQ